MPMNEKQFTKFRAQAAEAYEPAGGFDPTLILEILLDLLSKCKNRNPKRLKAAAKAPNLFEDFQVSRVVRKHLRDNDYNVRKFADPVQDAIYKMGANSTEADIAEFCGCCD
jgi:DNA-dependent RNA polymerase auxiliary subunit epsilon